MIIRKLTGKWYGDFLSERIFVPLCMTNTRPVSLSAVIPNRASGYFWSGEAYRKGDFVAESILSYGGGGILSTAPDMALWAIAVMSGKLLKPGSIESAWTPARLQSGGSAGYGLGWGIGRIEGHRIVSHNGGHMTGFTSALSIFPEDHLAVVVLLNRGGADPGRIARRVAGIYIPDLAPSPAKPIEDKEPEIAALLRKSLVKIAEQGLDEAQFTPAMWKVLSPQKEMIERQARSLGTLKSLELLSRSESGGLRHSNFRATFASQALTISFDLDRDDRIAGLEASEAE
jgi:hypothetical protein